MSEPDDRVSGTSPESVPDSLPASTERPRPARLPRVGIVLASAFVAGLVVVLLSVGARVGDLEARELEEVSTLVRAEGENGRVAMLSVDLHRDDEVVFEVCTNSALDPATWDGALTVAVVRTSSGGSEDVVRSPLDAELLAGARRSPTLTCLNAGQGVIEVDGTYVIELSWSAELPEAPADFRARTLARRSLGAPDRDLIFAILVLALLSSLALYLRPMRAGAGGMLELRFGIAIATAAALLLYGFMRYVTPYLPGGAVGGLVSGLSLAVFELVLAAALLVRAKDRLAILGIGRLESVAGASRLSRARPYLLLVLAPIAGLALYRIAGLALSIVPSTGEAPIEAFVSWPSGMLSFAALAVTAPIAEEVFFRGLVYGVLRGDGAGMRSLYAFVGSWMVFAVVHLPQTWGSWGGLLSIAIAALGFTALRAASGSVVVPAVAHLVYNGLLSAQALLSASSS
jgi:membrane protease YdiL (CAAX protease family)